MGVLGWKCYDAICYDNEYDKVVAYILDWNGSWNIIQREEYTCEQRIQKCKNRFEDRHHILYWTEYYLIYCTSYRPIQMSLICNREIIQ